VSAPGGIAPVGNGAKVGAVGGDGVMQASAAAARVEELRSLIAQVETGSPASEGSFGAQLAAATAVGGESAAIGQTVATTPTAVAGGRLNPSVPFAAEIEAAAAKYGLDPTLLAGLIKAESSFDPNAGSAAGAQGLTALMPEAASGAGVVDRHDPAESIDGGAHVLREMLDKFGGNVELALAAYNAGPGAVEQYNGIPPYSETQTYVPRVLGFAEEFRGGAAS
jgi:soluble lytic murein transglycosylase-like protein